ncbi:MAG: DUF2062 domain-containing protein [Opitutus sp.]
MNADDTPEDDPARLARRRRAKQLLRFVPRRAVFHKYPLIGRFAAFARRRAYLWSFRSENMRPAFYAGSILSLLPVMGVQLPVALVLSLVLRANFMVMGGLQFITNPFTAAPIYYATHQLGAKIIALSGVGRSIQPVDDVPLTPEPEPVGATSDTAAVKTPDVSPNPAPIHWTRRVGTAINALVIGGIVSGTILGAALDLLWRWAGAAHRHAPRRPPRGSHSTRTDRPPE